MIPGRMKCTFNMDTRQDVRERRPWEVSVWKDGFPQTLMCFSFPSVIGKRLFKLASDAPGWPSHHRPRCTQWLHLGGFLPPPHVTGIPGSRACLSNSYLHKFSPKKALGSYLLNQSRAQSVGEWVMDAHALCLCLVFPSQFKGERH